MQSTTFTTSALRPAAGTARRAARTAVKVYATSRVDKFSKSDIIVSWG
jgi:hypothetical protein